MTQQVRDIILSLMKSTGNYSQRRITGKTDKDAYISAMRQCIAVVENTNFVDYTDISMNLLYSKNNSNLMPWCVFSRPRYYSELAHLHAIEIVEKLVKRFITGAGDDELKGYEPIHSYEADGPF
jgi:hypothetical protein